MKESPQVIKFPLKRFTAGGLLTLLINYFMLQQSVDKSQLEATQTLNSISTEQMAILREERERDFVRKAELAATLVRLETKMDRIGADIGADIKEMSKQVSKIDGYLKARSPGGWSLAPANTFNPGLTLGPPTPEKEERNGS